MHRVIVRGTERRRILRSEANRELFLERLAYAAVMQHGLSFTPVARQVSLSRRSISRAIQRG